MSATYVVAPLQCREVVKHSESHNQSMAMNGDYESINAACIRTSETGRAYLEWMIWHQPLRG